MAIRESAQLRQLVSDYYHGLITAESYREQRASLLDNIGSAAGIEADVTKPRARSDTPAREHAPTVAAAAPAGRTSAGSGKWIIGVVVIAGLIAAGYLGLNFFQGQQTSTEMAGEVDSGAPVGRGNALVDGFLTRADWTRDSLGNFVLAWEALEQDQRTEVAAGRQYRRLTAQLHQRIREEIALGTGADNGQLNDLMEFAEAIGAPYRQSTVRDSTRPQVVDDAPLNDIPQDVQVPVTTEAQPALLQDDMREAPSESAVVHDAETEVTEPEAKPPVQKETSLSDEESPESAVVTDDPCPPKLASTRRPYCQDTLADGSAGPALVVLPTGAFEMGSDRFETESPRHRVNIAYHVAMSVYEVSVQEYLQFCVATGGECPASQPETGAPVVAVSWNDAADYAEWLTESTGFEYRLPSEAEWEYAARAGTQTPYSFGDEITPSSAHWSDSGAVDAPLAISERGVNRNPFRLYHMSGNVREWVLDSWFENYDGAPADGSARIDQAHDRKVVRGGSYQDPALNLRSAARESALSSDRDAVTGFRVVREIGDKPLKNNTP